LQDWSIFSIPDHRLPSPRIAVSLACQSGGTPIGVSGVLKAVIAPLKHIHWTTLLIVSFLGCWWIWAFDVATLYVAPGLLDDGSHIARALQYVHEGFHTMFAANWSKVLDSATPSRFYEVQYVVIGLYAKAFGTDLRYWYLSQFLLCTLTGIAGYLVVNMLTRNRVAAMLCLIGILTASPLADAARANFGKVEVVMSMTIVFALACMSSAAVLVQRPSSLSRNLLIVTTLFSGILFMTIASLAKESGKLLAVVPLIFPALAFGGPVLASQIKSRWPAWTKFASSFVEVKREYPRQNVSYGIICTLAAALILALSFYVFRERGQSSYLAAYFSLNFDPHYIVDSFQFYVRQTPDQIILLVALAPIVLFGFVSDSRSWAMLVSLSAIAASYMFLLFAFRYRVSYYFYVPAVMTAVAFAIGFALAPRQYQIVMLSVFVLTRAYSVPYIYFQAASQRYVDFVNFRAMQAATELGAPRVVLLDASEQNQLIQEWNLLRQPFFDNRLPPIFGGPPDFKAWAYQQRIRDFGLERDARRDGSGYITGVLSAAGETTSEPDTGDLVAVRFGKMRAGSIVVRAVLPFEANETATLTIIDTHSLVPVARVGGVIPGVVPCECGIGEFNFGWDFFRVVFSSPLSDIGPRVGRLDESAHCRSGTGRVPRASVEDDGRCAGLAAAPVPNHNSGKPEPRNCIATVHCKSRSARIVDSIGQAGRHTS
jgi:hypothetical protein